MYLHILDFIKRTFNFLINFHKYSSIDFSFFPEMINYTINYKIYIKIM